MNCALIWVQPIATTKLSKLLALRKNTSNALGADKIYDMLRDINVTVISNIEEKCENILKFANSNQEKAYEAHKKCKNTVFYVYPGITAIIAIIFI